jgi:hypothetical protein
MTPSERITLLAVAAGSILLALLVSLLRRRIFVTPKERERRRRKKLQTYGRHCDGMLVDVSESALFYTYSVSGVDYNASQDVSDLTHLMPDDTSRVIGPVTLKYFVRNPADSIVISEEWSGLRVRQTPVKEIPSNEEVL